MHDTFQGTVLLNKQTLHHLVFLLGKMHISFSLHINCLVYEMVKNKKIKNKTKTKTKTKNKNTPQREGVSCFICAQEPH